MFFVTLIIISDMSGNTVEPADKGFCLAQGRECSPRFQKGVLGQFAATLIIAHHPCEIKSNAVKMAFIDLFKGLLISSLGLCNNILFMERIIFRRERRVLYWMKHR